MQSACPSCSTRRRPWVLERLPRRSREANSQAFCEQLSPRRPLGRSHLANRNARKTPAGNGRKTASAPALGEQGTPPFAPFVQEGHSGNHNLSRRTIWDEYTWEPI